MKQENNQLLVLTHLSQLLSFVTGFGGLIVPLIIWVTQKDTIYKMDEQGKAIINFQLSVLIYAVICVPLILLFGLGVLGLIAIGLITLIFPIINAVKASNGEAASYPLSIRFLN